MLALALGACVSPPAPRAATKGQASAETASASKGAGYSFHEFIVAADDRRPERHIRLYEPDPRPSGPLPLVVIGPAGSRLFHGMEMDDAHSPEHTPWARAGFVVVTFSIDGALSDEDLQEGGAAADKAIVQFASAAAGADNASSALSFALAHTSIDSQRVFAVGHSSAATLALLFASDDPAPTSRTACRRCWTSGASSTGPREGHRVVVAAESRQRHSHTGVSLSRERRLECRLQ